MNNIWGPKLWNKLHTISFNYTEKPTEEEKEKIYIYFINLGNKLPCEACRRNYNKKLIKKPIAECLDNKEQLIKWVIDIHNMVNKDLNKPTYDYNTAIKLLKKNNNYDKMNKIQNIDDKKQIKNIEKKNYIYILLLVLLIFLLIFLVKYRK